ncbi:cytochrome P450 2B1-like [Tiliqua scincoides]|uniref:cytochrome P450 2B1-like n=1 Tax=Tiliqua scincoides TaxID=71010 RepID=UPI003462AF72
MWTGFCGVSKNLHNLPPGPSVWFALRNLWSLKELSVLQMLLKLREQFGDVFSLKIGSQLVVVLCGHKMVEAALVDQTEDFESRPNLPIVKKTNNSYGISFSKGERWKQIRRFALTTLRSFGMGKRSIEGRIQEEIGFLVEEFRKTQGSPFDPRVLLRCSVSNIICSMIFGERFQYDDREFRALIHLIEENIRQINSIWLQLYNFFPGVMKFLPVANSFFENYEEQKRCVSRMVQKHKDTLDPALPRDYIDAFLIKMQEDSGNLNTEFHQKNLVVSVLDLLFAGTETVTSTLRYSFLILLKYPHIVERIQDEIDQVVGQNRAVSMQDRSEMPYTDAVIHELQRFIDVNPLGLPRSTTQDTEFAGYVIPEGSIVFPMLHSVLNDPIQFKAPETFDPGHFLDESGAFQKPDAFIPFSAGKRSCLGEGLARTELFLYFTTILQNFVLTSPVPVEEIDFTPEYIGFGKAPRPHRLCFTPR